MKNQGDIYKYWGKASREENEQVSYHLLPYHCLDVAAMGNAWWYASAVIRNRFCSMTGLDEKFAYAWILFFISLHDLGKFDIRFQLKAARIASLLGQKIDLADAAQSRKFWHGEYAFYWLKDDLNERFQWDDDWLDENEKWESWKPWINAVAGHHGVFPLNSGLIRPLADKLVIEQDRRARLEFINEMDQIFLQPAGLSLDDNPPDCDQLFFAGFCSVCDWLGSTEKNYTGDKRFSFISRAEQDLEDYFSSKSSTAEKLLHESGLKKRVKTAGGMVSLFPKYKSHQVQTLVDTLPRGAGLALIEAPTGSGKTEAALAYASRLLALEQAESIIFALPTQATANAMLQRLIDVSKKLFAGTDLVLAHGKARFQKNFIDLKRAAKLKTPQNEKHEAAATVQCAEWLSQSRKRVFLGQIGVCTVDQVLISVLPVKHKFVRSFGLGKSVLIIDEVHAYDSYMYGLLDRVLKQQQAMGGSAILLSATMPLLQRSNLINAWDGDVDLLSEHSDYPLISYVGRDGTQLFPLSVKEKQRLKKQPERSVHIACMETVDMKPDTTLLRRIINAAESGANAVIICNLVADAQSIAATLQEQTKFPVELFHSRFRFTDRQQKEERVLSNYGKGENRKQGGILVATQVVEQSLDLDFDWMITQLCPIDLLFQRLGRLHRHDRNRPKGYDEPQCVVLLPENHNYELHKLIYGNQDAPNARVLWRTEQLVREHKTMIFPKHYRPLIEKVYRKEACDNEPPSVQKEFELFDMYEQANRMKAGQLADAVTYWEDSDANVLAMTRDGEMNLNVIPFVHGKNGRYFLDNGTAVAELEEWEQAEAMMLNSVPVPASWKKYLPPEEDGIIWLEMEPAVRESWSRDTGKCVFMYSMDKGLEKQE